ncbi:MAG: non-canonical purine NTP pyrophosphatase [Candidatus Marsarchaeota archaeon]|nr:non-canonical purine NTP pyrophosphatase [Candidatus Marsarchaeota archaeon]
MGKYKEASSILSDFRIRMKTIELREIQSVQVREVVSEKAKEAYRKLRRPLFVEDTGLYIDAMNGFPGALAKPLIESVGTAGVCRMVDSFGRRSAYAETCIGYADGRGVKVFSGKVGGRIAGRPRGDNGFGWDPVFVPDGHAQTFAQMPMTEKNRISHRAMAFRAFGAYMSRRRSAIREYDLH